MNIRGIQQAKEINWDHVRQVTEATLFQGLYTPIFKQSNKI